MQKGLVRKEHYAYQKNGSCTFFVAIEPCDTVFARQPIAAIPSPACASINLYRDIALARLHAERVVC